MQVKKTEINRRRTEKANIVETTSEETHSKLQTDAEIKYVCAERSLQPTARSLATTPCKKNWYDMNGTSNMDGTSKCEIWLHGRKKIGKKTCKKSRIVLNDFVLRNKFLLRIKLNEFALKFAQNDFALRIELDDFVQRIELNDFVQRIELNDFVLRIELTNVLLRMGLKNEMPIKRLKKKGARRRPRARAEGLGDPPPPPNHPL